MSARPDGGVVIAGRLLLMSIYAGCGLLSAAVVAAVVPGADIRYVGAEIDRGRPVDVAVVKRVALEDPALLTSCNGDTLRALRTVTLYYLEQQNQIADYDAWAQAFTTARASFRHALSCAPGDGYTWAAYAMVEAAIAAEPTVLNGLLDMSLWTAPVETNALAGRFRARRLAGEAAAGQFKAALEEDSRTAVLYLPPRDVAAIANALSPTYRQAILDAAATIGPKRRKWLRDAGLPLRDEDIPPDP